MSVDRRREPRERVSQIGFMRRSEPWAPQRHFVRIVDVSGGGMKLHASEQMEVGGLVEVQSSDRRVLAEVRHCTEWDDSFFIGVRIDSDLPRHLTGDDLSAYVNCELDATEANRIEAHLQICEACVFKMGEGIRFLQQMRHLAPKRALPSVCEEPTAWPERGGMLQSLIPFSTCRASIRLRGRRGGLWISGSQSLAAGTIVRVHVDDVVLIGAVRAGASRRRFELNVIELLSKPASAPAGGDSI